MATTIQTGGARARGEKDEDLPREKRTGTGAVRVQRKKQRLQKMHGWQEFIVSVGGAMSPSLGGLKGLYEGSGRTRITWEWHYKPQ